MRRFCLVILALLSLALLPGPAHALLRDQPMVGHAHIAGAQLETSAKNAAIDHDHDCPGHHHGAACDTACCAPMCSLDVPPTATAARVAHAQAPPMPTSDRPRPDADASRSPRPPEPA